jgi:hypothetical protein
MDASRELLEEALKRSLLRTAEGPTLSYNSFLRKLILRDICPDQEGGYRWSSASNYMRSCSRALRDGRPQPASRAKLLSPADRARIWGLAFQATALWCELCRELGSATGDELYIHRSKLMLTAIGKRLFAVTPEKRLRPSILAEAA